MKDIIFPGRKVGNTTRIIDLTIQQLFIDGKAPITDHHVSSNDSHLKHILRVIITRLANEHHMVEGQDFTIKKFVITLKNR